MKWVCTKINELSHRTGIGNMKLFITVSMVVCGLAGCAAALLLHMLPVLGDVSFAKLMFICGGYGMFLVGMLGSAVYLLINEPRTKRTNRTEGHDMSLSEANKQMKTEKRSM